jgi:murein DD-endopeptidase MepM/ murein hydrolase activator NlpD
MDRWGKLLTPLVVAVALLGGLIAPSVALAMALPGDEFVLTFPQLDSDTKFLSEYGVSKPDGRTHRGVDLFASRGTEVIAGADGFVQKVQRGSRAGLYVVLTHPDGYETWYLHLGSFADGIEVGDPVAGGDVIGYVGSTGNAAGTSPHTHFEIHKNGRPIDPYPFLRASFERWVLSQQIEAGETPFR